MKKENTRKNNITKYGFKTIRTGDIFDVDRDKIVSMKNSLRSYNKAHKLNIEIDYQMTKNDKVIKVTCINGSN